MKVVKEPAPIICEGCGKVFKAKYAFYCPKCIKQMCSERAKRIGLNELGLKARWKKESEVAERREGVEESPVDSSTPSVTDLKGDRG